MQRSRLFPLVLFAAFGLLGSLETTHAAITCSGDIVPADPTTWDSSTYGYVGKTADGSLSVDDDSDLLSRYGYIAYDSGVTGQVTVTGAGSTWTNSDHLVVGRSGAATLTIADGGAVSVADITSVADPPYTIPQRLRRNHSTESRPTSSKKKGHVSQ